MLASHLLRGIAAASILLAPALYAESRNADAQLIMALRLAVRDAPDISAQMDTVAWLASMSKQLETRIPDPFYRIDLLKTIHTEASRAELNPELVLALVEVESQFDRFAVSRSGARGLMQVMPFWMKEIGHPQDNLFRPHTNLRYGCTILKYYLDQTGGAVRVALERYNGSDDKTAYADKVLTAFNSTWLPSAGRTVSE